MESNDRPIFPGIASGVLNVSASSEYDPSSAAYRCRLDYQNREGSQSWRAGSDNLEQYFQVSSPFPYRFHEIITKGGGSTEQWVRSYLIKYTLTGANWKYYNNCEKLKANEDTNSYHGNTLKSFVATPNKMIRANAVAACSNLKKPHLLNKFPNEAMRFQLLSWRDVIDPHKECN